MYVILITLSFKILPHLSCGISTKNHNIQDLFLLNLKLTLKLAEYEDRINRSKFDMTFCDGSE
jgi:hypothetical protein